MHYIKRYFIAGHSLMGERNHQWNGGKYLNDLGYIMIHLPNYPRARSTGYVPEHIFVFEMFHQCCILEWGVVHHINGIKTDNRPDNLMLVTNRQHRLIHSTKIHNNVINSGIICPRCSSEY
jgi:hypothetical protein